MAMNRQLIFTLMVISALFLTLNADCQEENTTLPLVFTEEEFEYYKENYVTQDVYKIDLQDDTSIERRGLNVEELISNSMNLARKGKFNEALQFLQQAIEKDPENKEAQRLMADIYNENGEPEKSIDIYNKLIEQESNNYDLYNSRGYAYGRLGLFEKALEDYNKALSINPDFVNSISNRAGVYARMGNMELAKKDYERLVEFDEAQGNFGLGNVAAANQEWQLALELFDKVIKASPNFPQAYIMRGQILLQLGYEEEAAQDLKQAQYLGIALSADLESLASKY